MIYSSLCHRPISRTSLSKPDSNCGTGGKRERDYVAHHYKPGKRVAGDCHYASSYIDAIAEGTRAVHNHSWIKLNRRARRIRALSQSRACFVRGKPFQFTHREPEPEAH
jgi:hypothetical protein